jgi:mannosyltransferase OCH1-like enzyme
VIKKVHYCWFGGKAPANVAANVEKWKRLNPDFEFCEWNDGNTDISAYAYGRRALEQKRWAYAADIVRLQKLVAEGGFYLDTDVELLRPLSALAEEADYLVMGYMYNCALGTAVFYSPPGHPLLAGVLEEYHHIRPGLRTGINTIITDYFLNHVPGFLLNGRRWKSEDSKISLYPKEFFCQPAFVRERGLSIHHFSGSWIPRNEGKAFQVRGGGTSHKIKWLKRKVRTFLALRHSEYLRAYVRALVGLPTRKPTVWKNDDAR